MRELILFLLLGIATLNAQKNVQSISYKNEKIEIYNTDLIVKVKTQHKIAFEEMFLNRNDIKVNTKRKSKYYQLVHVNKIENLLKVKDELEATKFFEFVEFNTLGKAEITPNDNYYNSGQQYAVNKIRLPEAWDVTTGNTNIIVGILDSGIPKSNSNLSHSELNDISKYIDGIDATDEIDGSIKDEYGHGAHVLGIVGALSNNSDGIVGANWNSKFRISQVFEGDGGTNPLFVADAIYDAVDNGVKIINYSGSNSSSALITNAITYAKNNDVLFVTSAGNGYGGVITFPATLASSYDNVIAVTGTNSDDLLGEFSSIGAEATISAPGESVYSTMPNYQVYLNSHDYNYTQNYSVMSGTSMASPYVAGVASLMLSVNQNLKPHQIKEVLKNTAVDLGVYGRDNLYGSGRIDAYRAVKASQILLNNPSAQFITSTKQSSQELVEDWYYANIGNTPYLVRRYKMEVEFDLSMLLDDPSNSLFWFNSNGISGASPNNENPWSYIVQQIGNIVTVKTFNYELKNYFSQDPIGWYRDPSELEIMFLAYGDEPQPSATVSPTNNNVGSVKADTYVTGSFTIYNTGGTTLNLTIQSQTNFDLDPSNSITYEPIIYKTLAPGSSTTVNYDGSMGGAVDYGPFTSTITIKDNANSISKTHTVIGTLLLPDFCYGETTAMAASPEELLFDKAFVDFYVADTLQIETKIGEKREKKSIKERLDFAYNLLKKDKTEKVENICQEIIELYPESEMGISFYAMGLLWEAAYSDLEVPDFTEKDFKKYLKKLTDQKEKFKINGYAQLILSLLDVGNDIEGLEKLFSDYEYDGLKELALFHQFIHYYIYKQDYETARKVADQLDKMFIDSRYGYQAHLIFGDEGYTLEGLKELLKKKQESLLAKRGESKNDILSEMPKEYKLFNNYPNPFNPSTTITYSVPKVSNVKLQVYNMMGQLIKTLVNETKAPGFYNILWSGTNENDSKVASGIYFFRFESENFIANNKMILIK